MELAYLFLMFVTFKLGVLIGIAVGIEVQRNE